MTQEPIERCLHPVCSALAEYVPEVWSVNKDAVLAAINAIESGLEYARQCLLEHDTSLGRTTHKNRTWAETIEGDIAQMELALTALPTRKPNDQVSQNRGAKGVASE